MAASDGLSAEDRVLLEQARAQQVDVAARQARHDALMSQPSSSWKPEDSAFMLELINGELKKA